MVRLWFSLVLSGGTLGSLSSCGGCSWLQLIESVNEFKAMANDTSKRLDFIWSGRVVLFGHERAGSGTQGQNRPPGVFIAPPPPLVPTYPTT